MSGRRWLLGGAGALVATVGLAAGGLWVVQERLDQDALRVRVEYRFRRDYGRDLRIDALRVRLLPVPEVDATGIAIADRPGGTRAAMLTAARISAHLDPVALFRHELRLQGLTLWRPDLELERDTDGTANWRFEPEPGRGGSGHGAGTRGRWAFSIGSVRVEDGRLRWDDRRARLSGAVGPFDLSGSGLDGNAPRIFAAGGRNGARWQLTLDTGALRRVLDRDGGGGAPWPVRIAARATAPDGTLLGTADATGTLAEPGTGRGYDLSVRATTPRLDGLDVLFPHANLPVVADLRLDARAVDAAPAGTAAARPELRRLSLHAGSFAAGAVSGRRELLPLLVRRLELTAPAAGAPVQLDAAGSWRGLPATLRGRVGILAGWRMPGGPDDDPGGPVAPQAVALRATAGAATLAADGTVERDAARFRLAVDAPDWRALAARGPELTRLHGEATLALARPGRVSLTGLRIEARELALGGTASLDRPGSGRPTVAADLDVERADLDALRAGLGRPTPTPTPTGSATPVSDPRVPVAVRPGAPAQGARPGGGVPLPGMGAPIPAADGAAAGEREIPFAALLRADGTVSVRANRLRAGGTEYRNLSSRLVVSNGNAVLDPFRVDGPGGTISVRATADAGSRTATLELQPATLPAAELANWFNRDPEGLAGMVELVATLRGAGGTWPGMLRSLSGTAGASMVDGSANGAALGRLVGAPVPLRGTVPVRCFAAAARVADGSADLFALALDADRITATGAGRLRLADGTLDLHLSPHLSVGGAGASLPVRVGGTLDAPTATPDRAGPGGRVVLEIGPGVAAPDPCPAGLAAARFGVPGPAPAAAPPKRRGGKAVDFLRGLLGGIGR